MEEAITVPAAQYLRVSTEHQQYSVQNQSQAIAQYAASNGLEVVRTYSDNSRSGLVLRERPALRQLLGDVVSGKADYKAVLVYDVSRWGRFQDIDESAHYEFLCKSAGIPVHYCAETFPNDLSLPSLIMKALKRTMAGEYSRELSAKVFAGQRRLAQLGYHAGAVPGYGLRRMLISKDGARKQLLADGEHKSIATDRVILVPGPPEEVHWVRQIYQMLISEGLGYCAIARRLNAMGVKHVNGSQWTNCNVRAIVSSPKYAGINLYGRTAKKLGGPWVLLPASQWSLTQNAFEPIVDQATFLEAQRTIHNRSYNQTDEELLNSLRYLLKEKGKLSHSEIDKCPNMPCTGAFSNRFGSLRRAYQLIGYNGRFGRGWQFIETRKRLQEIRAHLLAEIDALFPEKASIVRHGGRKRVCLRFGRTMVSVLICRCITNPGGTTRWLVAAIRGETHLPTLLVRLNLTNSAIQDLTLIPKLTRKNVFRITLKDPFLQTGIRLKNVGNFLDAMLKIGWQAGQRQKTRSKSIRRVA